MVRVVGIDLDNTILLYDEIFLQTARRLGLLDPTATLTSKRAIRDSIRSRFGDRRWIELQAEVYGRPSSDPPVASGFLDFLARCLRDGVVVHIISHKTLRPAGDASLDLHAAAHQWLRSHGIVGPAGISPQNVFFEQTLQEKLARIQIQHCTWYIDDMLEVLCAPGFPAGVSRVLYDPEAAASLDESRALGIQRSSHWGEIASLLFTSSYRGPS